jgi:hypothetical protein
MIVGGGPSFLAGTTNKVGARFFAFFAKGGTGECGRKFVDPSRVVTNQMAHAASIPTLAKNARMGQPLSGWPAQQS